MPTTLLLVSDLQRSPLGGSGLAVRAYTPYGASSGGSGLKLGFAGQHRERPAATYLLGNGRRVYNPLLMRFHSPDTLSPFGRGGSNAYAYCSGDPVNHVDPSGGYQLVAGQTASGVLNVMFLVNSFSRGSQAFLKRGQNQPPTAIASTSTFLSYAGAVTGLAARGLTFEGADRGPGNVLTEAGLWMGVVSQGLTFTGASLGLFETGRTTVRNAREQGIPLRQVVLAGVSEASGVAAVTRAWNRFWSDQGVPRSRAWLDDVEAGAPPASSPAEGRESIRHDQVPEPEQHV